MKGTLKQLEANKNDHRENGKTLKVIVNIITTFLIIILIICILFYCVQLSIIKLW